MRLKDLEREDARHRRLLAANRDKRPPVVFYASPTRAMTNDPDARPPPRVIVYLVCSYPTGEHKQGAA